MILRRLAQNLREQNWTAIAIEFVLLVLGVFLGIQVANWNEDRQQAARQANYLERLRIDFVGIRDRIQQHDNAYRDMVEGGELILSLLRADADALKDIPVENSQMARAYDALLSNRIPPPLPATYIEMRSEGQLSHIANPELRDRLAEYDRVLGLLLEVSRLTGDNLNLQAPVLQRYFTSRTVIDVQAMSGIREELLAFDVAGMRGDRDFAVAVKLLHRNASNSRQMRRLQLEQVDKILALIEQEQRR